VDHRGFSSRQAFDAELVRRLVDAGVDTVALAGFMRILTPVFLEAFAGRVLNIHPAILPAFPGVHAQGQQADYGVRLAGCTVHFVDEHMDHGPIIIQAAVPATPQDTPQRLGERILALEHRIYPQALAWLASGRITVRGRQVEVAGADYAGGGRYWTVPTLEPPFDVDWAAAS
jgi:phosphoribosylglycinamide formyltransferase-1